MEKATKRQLWALYCITKKDYRNENLSKEDASKLLSELIDKKQENKPQQSLLEEFLKFMQDHIIEVVNTAKQAMQYESVIMNDTNVVKDDGKRYFFCGFGCGIVWFNYDKRSKKAKEIEQLFHDNSRKIEAMFLSYFDTNIINKYNSLGFPIAALFQQDEQVKLSTYYLVKEFMENKGIKHVRVLSRLD